MHAADYKIFLCDVINPLSETKATYETAQALILVREKMGHKNSKSQHLSKDRPAYKIDSIIPISELLGPNGPFFRGDVEMIDARHMTAMPGLYDMHFHWVQDDVREMPKDSLLEWLSKYTWPYEQKFSSKSFALKKAQLFKRHLIECGTIGGACFASIHEHSVDLALKNFIGDFVVGNVLMTMNSPKGLTQKTKDAIHLVEKLSKKFGSSYALTPRFAPTTHPEVMQKTAKIAHKNNSFIQSHLSETKEEIDYVLSLFKKMKGFEKVKSYTEIYQRCGILGPKTLMGHGIHLSSEELKILKKTKTAIIHCPTSNAPVKEGGLGSGLMNWRVVSKAGVRWALGSDIGGGPYLSMFDVMRSFVEQNKKQKRKASFVQALYRSTIAAAEILGIEKSSGNLLPGKRANFILVESGKLAGQRPKKRTAEEVLAQLIKQNEKKRDQYRHMVKVTFIDGQRVL